MAAGLISVVVVVVEGSLQASCCSQHFYLFSGLPVPLSVILLNPASDYIV